MAELKPCPFCGDNQQLNYVELSNGLHYIECARCGAAPHRLGARNRETAVKYWNSVSRWIPCSERMPDGNRAVLVQYNEMYADGVHKQYAVAFYGKYTRHWIEPCSGQHLNVTKWQELDIQPEKE